MEGGGGGGDISISVLPVNVLIYVFCFLPGRSLCNCGCVSKFWRNCSDADPCWKINCVALWKHKAPFGPSHRHEFNAKSKSEFKSIAQTPKGDTGIETVTLFHKIRLTREVANTLSVRELKTLLRDRGVDYSYCIDVNDFRKEFIATSPAAVENWSFRHSSKWKASYVYSIFDGKRDSITSQELTDHHYKWTSFHPIQITVGTFDVVESSIVFGKDGTFEMIGTNADDSILVNRGIWNLKRTLSHDGKESRQVVFGIGEVNFKITRLSDWRWELYDEDFDWKIVN
mmetsp:Transcript_2095/g.2684  ORF Transcript_2095/g.2684 Transcript_2095/m.2684 type:complete len:285 (-) Transcript_2095:581-1435(-)|eukprot:CAMPEP_0204829284 /NCGR_PEP_ID=MMETSP1346-20131115/7390_1 /ASSEMBLY_ACC=CAM_ASM_000771 /TAXON_ID=215587 /ORGANISM="Aplanochytrium stocchinoi, Strain GSBS06" /LENGTH=284 /DNA_ID=CAMNT_0051958951 /DNA_START=271 /DNA_END=1125 /DNA_ORIENTATION=-